MKNLYILGFGCGDKGDITLKTLNILKKSDEVFARTVRHPSAEILDEYGIKFTSFDHLYESSNSFDGVYGKICNEVLNSKGENVSYIVPGSAVIAEKSVNLLLNKAKCAVTVVPSVSFLDGIFAELKTDAINSFKMIDALSLDEQKPDTSCLNIVCQVYDKEIASDVKLALSEYYDDETEVYLLTSSATENSITEKLKLYEIDFSENINHLTSLVIPPQNSLSTPREFDSLVYVIAALRGENGCPWDKEQTHETLTPYVVEEAYEVVSAIKKKDCDNLCEELGDLLLQVVLHAQIAEEKNEFNIHDVINSVNQKMVRRHPHVFANSGLPEDLYKNWDEIKKDEHKYCTITEEMKDVAEALPALTYAEKIQKKAAKVHFDFKNADEALKKLSEECAELKAAMDKGNNESIFEECGDVLFSAVNVMRLLKQSPEDALRNSIAKFMNRFETVENEMLAKGENIAEKTEQELDELWIRAKAKQ